MPVTRVFDGVLVHALRRRSLAQLLDGELLKLRLQSRSRIMVGVWFRICWDRARHSLRPRTRRVATPHACADLRK